HDEIVAELIHFTPLIAGDDAGRNARGAHDDGEGGGIVLAEAAARLEQELVDGIGPEQHLRREGVEKALVAEQGKGRQHELAVVRVLAAELASQLDRARIEALGKRERAPQRGAVFLRAVAELEK